MKVAVITPYHSEPLEYLKNCHNSVVAQTHACTHVMVADGMPRDEISSWPVQHIVLPLAHNDVGSTPRLVGSYHAVGSGFDAVAFLDADNWYRPDHIERLVMLHKQTGSSFVSSSRVLCRIDGSVLMPKCPSTDPEKFVDTSCMLMARGSFHLLHHWVLMPSYAHPISDRVMLHYIKEAGIKRTHSDEPTVFYRCSKAGIYRKLGERLPSGVQEPADFAALFQRWETDRNPPIR